MPGRKSETRSPKRLQGPPTRERRAPARRGSADSPSWGLAFPGPPWRRFGSAMPSRSAEGRRGSRSLRPGTPSPSSARIRSHAKLGLGVPWPAVAADCIRHARPKIGDAESEEVARTAHPGTPSPSSARIRRLAKLGVPRPAVAAVCNRHAQPSLADAEKSSHALSPTLLQGWHFVGALVTTRTPVSAKAPAHACLLSPSIQSFARALLPRKSPPVPFGGRWPSDPLRAAANTIP